MALFRCPKDPRTMSFPMGPIPLPQEPPLARTLRSSVNEGHYVIYLHGNSGSIHPRTPTLDVLLQTSSIINLSLHDRSSFPPNSSGEAVPHRRLAHLLRAAHHLV